jgi:hypothetical protein
MLLGSSAIVNGSIYSLYAIRILVNCLFAAEDI